MCGRYVFDNSDALEKRFHVNVAKTFKPNYNTAPGQFMPVIREDRDGRDVLEEMKWGLIPSWAKEPNIGYKLINARSETVFEKPAWRSAIKSRRCLIPATSFYEWKRDGTTKKQPYYITLKNHKLMYFAGIWESWHNSEGTEVHSYAILTITPNKEMSELHDRMPVILHKNDEDLWIHEDDHDYIEHVLRPYDDDSLLLSPVSKDVNIVKNNSGDLILPINSK